MKTITPKFVVAFAVAFFAAAQDGHGQILVQHWGSTDPTTEGFSLFTAGAQSTVGPISGDMGYDAWITAVSEVNNNVAYRWVPTPEQQALLAGADWTLTLGLRVVASAAVLGNNYARFSTGSERFVVLAGSRLDGDPFVVVGTSSASPTFEFEGGGPGYHEYELRYSAASGTVDLWADGVLRLSGLSASAQTPNFFLEWGQSQAAPSQANWNLVSLEVVPEPSSAVLLAVGMGALIFQRLSCVARASSSRRTR